MIDRETYFNLKLEIKYLSYNNVIKLCENMNLNTEEKTLLLNFYENKTRVSTCMEMGISEDVYTNNMKKLFTKIYNYKNTLD